MVNCGIIKSKKIQNEFLEMIKQIPQSKCQTDVGSFEEEFEIDIIAKSRAAYTPQYPSAYNAHA